MQKSKKLQHLHEKKANSQGSAALPNAARGNSTMVIPQGQSVYSKKLLIFGYQIC